MKYQKEKAYGYDAAESISGIPATTLREQKRRLDALWNLCERAPKGSLFASEGFGESFCRLAERLTKKGSMSRVVFDAWIKASMWLNNGYQEMVFIPSYKDFCRMVWRNCA